MIENRGGHLAAPLPRNGIGQCGYLNEITQSELYEALSDYEKICRSMERKGRGFEAHCRDVGLEDPSTAARSLEIAG